MSDERGQVHFDQCDAGHIYISAVFGIKGSIPDAPNCPYCKLEERSKLLRDLRKDLELRATCHNAELVVQLGSTLYNRLCDATEDAAK